MTRVALLAAGAVLALVAAGCGGDSNETTEDWAQSVCQAVGDWRESVQSTAEGLTGGGTPSADELRDAADDVRSATDDLVGELRDIDAPESGEVAEARDAVQQLGDDVEERRGAIDDAIDSAESNPSAAAVFDVAAKVAAALRDTARELTTAFQGAGDEVSQAFSDAEACNDLTGSS
jgi:hypothetical protein